VYSIDECFADLSGLPNRTALGHEIRNRIFQWIRIPTCVGIGSSKVLAKLANHVAKKNKDWNGVCNFADLSSTQLDAILESVTVRDIWGIGSKLSVQLHSMGITTARQLRDANQSIIRQRFGVVVERIGRELAGYSCLDITEVNEPNQQIIRSRSFGQLVTEKIALQAAISSHVSNAAAALREQDTQASVLTVFIHTNRFREHDAQYVGSKTASLDQTYKSGYLYKKAGVRLSGIESVKHQQADLFTRQNNPAREQLMAAMDNLNEKYGRGTVQVATAMQNEDWRMCRERLSPCYTTRAGELLTPHC
jgi:DNA polymerase V